MCVSHGRVASGVEAGRRFASRKCRERVLVPCWAEQRVVVRRDLTGRVSCGDRS